MRKGCTFLCFLALLSVGGLFRDVTADPETRADQLVSRSIAFHDPRGVWGNREVSLSWVGTNPDGEERLSLEMSFGRDAAHFAMQGTYRGHQIDYSTSAEGWTATVDGDPEPSAELRQRMALDREDGFLWRSYFGFLAWLPMKLTDPGTHVGPDVGTAQFNGEDVQVVRVTYDPEVGGDTWYFYFDPETAQLMGCRFHHDEQANDGEYIVFEDLVTDADLRLPRVRKWFVNENDRFLGRDEIRALRVRP